MLYDKLDHSAENWALITGASSGIGAAFARRLAAQQHHLILVARREARLRQLADDLSRVHGVRVEVLVADLATDDGINQVVSALREAPPMCTLVSAAGFGTRAFFAEIPPERLEQMVRLHTQAGVRLTRAVVPSMIDRHRGTIIHVSSLAGFFTSSRYVVYGATKAFLNTFCEGLAEEVGPQGVRVQALICGLTRTEFMNSSDFSEFNYSKVPEFLWMQPDRVVDESLQALDKGGPVHFIAGAHNRAFVNMLTAPVLGALARVAIDKLGGRDFY
jgi:uncharacterized protein